MYHRFTCVFSDKSRGNRFVDLNTFFQITLEKNLMELDHKSHGVRSQDVGGQ